MPQVARTLVMVLFALAANPSAQARGSRMSVLPGTITIDGDVMLPPGSILRVYLSDLSPGVAKSATVANQAFEISGKRPIQFELPYNPTGIEPSRLYGLGAAITNSRGQALLETRVPIRVLTLGNQKEVELVLRPVQRPPAPPEPTSVAVECEGLRFHVDLSTTSATLVLPESKVVLPITEAVSGKRFSDGAFTLAMSGSAAYFQRPGKAYRDCKVSPEAESRPEP